MALEAAILVCAGVVLPVSSTDCSSSSVASEGLSSLLDVSLTSGVRELVSSAGSSVVMIDSSLVDVAGAADVDTGISVETSGFPVRADRVAVDVVASVEIGDPSVSIVGCSKGIGWPFAVYPSLHPGCCVDADCCPD